MPRMRAASPSADECGIGLRHLKSLSLHGRSSLNFVIMFVLVELAFALANERSRRRYWSFPFKRGNDSSGVVQELLTSNLNPRTIATTVGGVLCKRGSPAQVLLLLDSDKRLLTWTGLANCAAGGSGGTSLGRNRSRDCRWVSPPTATFCFPPTNRG